MQEFFRIAVAIGTVSLALAGCDQVEQKLPPESVQDAGAVPEDPHGSRPTTASAALLKLRLYDHAISRISPSIIGSSDHYFRTISNRRKGPTAAEAGRIKIHSIRASVHDREPLKSAHASKPAMKSIDAVAELYQQRVSELLPLLEKARFYYMREGPKPKALEMHGPLAKAYKAAIAAEQQLRQVLEPALDEAEVGELVQLKVDPKRKTLWKWRMMYRDSKLLMKLFADHNGNPSHADAEAALDRFAASFNSFPELKQYQDHMSASQCLAASKEHVKELKTKHHLVYPPRVITKAWTMYEKCQAFRVRNVTWGLLRRKSGKAR